MSVSILPFFVLCKYRKSLITERDNPTGGIGGKENIFLFVGYWYKIICIVEKIFFPKLYKVLTEIDSYSQRLPVVG
jgi:hypothetical protein